MPLLDHFHPPLYPQRAPGILSLAARGQLDRRCPASAFCRRANRFAEVQIHLGSRVEADVAGFEQATLPQSSNGSAGSVAVQTYAPPAATYVLPAVFPDDLEVQVLDQRDDARLVAVVELVSPRITRTARQASGRLRRSVRLICNGVLASWWWTS